MVMVVVAVPGADGNVHHHRPNLQPSMSLTSFVENIKAF
jgi:hypothetical protein